MIAMLEDIVRRAGAKAREAVLVGNVMAKGHNDFVTGADLAVNELLSRELTALVPGSRVMSEEGDTKSPTDGTLFIIDPIDGTTNLMYHLQLSCISVGYAEDGDVKAAVVLNPFTDELFSAEKGKGAFLNGVRMQVSSDRSLEEALIGFESGITITDGRESFFGKMYQFHAMGRGVRSIGSAALDLAYVACGRFSGCAFHYLYPWDYAAGLLLLEEAGGKLTTTAGDALDLQGRSGVVVASNTLLHEAMLSVMSE